MWGLLLFRNQVKRPCHPKTTLDCSRPVPSVYWASPSPTVNQRSPYVNCLPLSARQLSACSLTIIQMCAIWSVLVCRTGRHFSVVSCVTAVSLYTSRRRSMGWPSEEIVGLFYCDHYGKRLLPPAMMVECHCVSSLPDSRHPSLPLQSWNLPVLMWCCSYIENVIDFDRVVQKVISVHSCDRLFSLPFPLLPPPPPSPVTLPKVIVLYLELQIFLSRTW